MATDAVNPKRVLVIGDTTIDHFVELSTKDAEPQCELDTHACKLLIPYGEKLPIQAYEAVIAGNGANAAVGGARLGLESAIWTVMGDDQIGHQAKTHFVAEHVNVRHLELVKGEQSNVSVVLRVLGERTIFAYHYPRTYHLPAMDHAGWVYLTSMAKGWEVIIDSLVDHLTKHPAKLVFQPGEHQLKSGHVAARDLLHRTELIILNKEEAADYLNHDRSTPIRQLLVGLHALGPKIVVVTDGPAGSYGSDGTNMWRLGVRTDVERVEATGAGDGYATALMVALAHGEPLNEAMSWGNVNAESIIGYVGAQRGILHLAEMQDRLKDPKRLKAEPYHG